MEQRGSAKLRVALCRRSFRHSFFAVMRSASCDIVVSKKLRSDLQNRSGQIDSEFATLEVFNSATFSGWLSYKLNGPRRRDSLVVRGEFRRFAMRPRELTEPNFHAPLRQSCQLQ